MGTMRIVRVCSDGSLDLLPGRRKLPILRERHRMISGEPKIIAVVRGQAVHQHRDLAFLSDATGAANQAVRVCGTGDYQRVARPCRQMFVQCRDRCVCSAREHQVEEPDVTGLALRQTGSHVLGCPKGTAC